LDLAKWKYKSVGWIHKVREENYEKTIDKDLKTIIEDSVKTTKIITSKSTTQ
jgi:hypothetical protein